MGHYYPFKELFNDLRFSTEQQKKFEKVVKPYIERPPKRLYHYTTATGLLGMLKEKNLRASLATHLNDSAEVILGQKIIWERLAKPWQERKMGHDLDPHEAWANVYVSCFSDRSDDLGQWRAYSGARGYKLTFDTTKLSPERLLIRVLYTNSDGSVDKRVEEVIGHLVEFYDTELYAAEGLTRENLIKSVKRGLAVTAAAHKPYGFSAESEWRIIFWCEHCDDLNFAERAGRVVPFHPIPFDDLGSLVEVMVGPGFDPQLETVAVKTLLNRRELHNVDVTITEHGSYRAN